MSRTAAILLAAAALAALQPGFEAGSRSLEGYVGAIFKSPELRNFRLAVTLAPAAGIDVGGTITLEASTLAVPQISTIRTVAGVYLRIGAPSVSLAPAAPRPQTPRRTPRSPPACSSPC